MTNQVADLANDDQALAERTAVRSVFGQASLAAWLVLFALGVTFLWSYWPTLLGLVRIWDSSPDYSHGYLVVPLALYFLWARREQYPGLHRPVGWSIVGPVVIGSLLIAASIGIRWLGARYRLGAVDGWSMMVWVAGVVWVLGGWRLFRWSWTSVAFLFFMIPLPWRFERALSVPLQRVATEISTWTLQVLGQPAFAQGNVISLGDQQLEVAEACSGLRILVGIAAIAFAYCVLIRNSWWKRLAVLLATIPVALTANATRVVVTALLYRLVSVEAGQKFSHDVVGWLMIPFAAALFALVVLYFDRLFPEVERVEMSQLFQRGKERAPRPAVAPRKGRQSDLPSVPSDCYQGEPSTLSEKGSDSLK